MWLFVSSAYPLLSNKRIKLDEYGCIPDWGVTIETAILTSKIATRAMTQAIRTSTVVAASKESVSAFD